MTLEERVLKLEAETAVQAALIRALVAMLPPPHPMNDAPLKNVPHVIAAAAEKEPEPYRTALQVAAQELHPAKMERRRG